jgi:MinD superfamily P-loop ATPase
MPPHENGRSNIVIAVAGRQEGKGTTMVVASLAYLAESKGLADSDVDAADLHLLRATTVREAHDLVGDNETVIDPDKGIASGRM